MAAVKTKAYTINRLIREVRSLNTRKVTDFKSFANELSPRLGTKSAKVKVLNRFLGGNLAVVISAATLGYNSNVKSAVLTALRTRKSKGYYYFD